MPVTIKTDMQAFPAKCMENRRLFLEFDVIGGGLNREEIYLEFRLRGEGLIREGCLKEEVPTVHFLCTVQSYIAD